MKMKMQMASRISVILLIPLLAGCMATQLTIAAGKRAEYFKSFDSVRRHGDEYIVQYEMEVRDYFQNIVRVEKRAQLITPKFIKTLTREEIPSWFNDAKELPIRTIPISTDYTADQYRHDESAFVFVNPAVFRKLEKPYLVITAKDPSTGLTEEKYRLGPTGRNYREPWGYPVAILGSPFALILDIVTFPIQFFQPW